MEVIGKQVLTSFIRRHANSKNQISTWLGLVESKNWENINQVKESFSSKVSVLKNDRAIFNVKGNSYRIVARLDFNRKVVKIQFVGTHAEYDKIDANTV